MHSSVHCCCTQIVESAVALCAHETWVEFMMHGVTCTCPYSPCLHAGNWWRSRAAVRTRALQCLHFPSWRATRYCTWLGMQASLFDQAILYYMPCLWPHCFTNERPRLMAPAQLGRVVRHDAHAVVHRHNHPNKPRRRGHCGLVECSVTLFTLPYSRSRARPRAPTVLPRAPLLPGL